MRVNFPNGDWLDLVDRLNYAQAMRINAAGGKSDAAGTILASLVTGWALRDVEDNAIEFPGREADGIPLEALSRIPWDTFELATAEALKILPEQPDPKDTSETSTGSVQASPSASRRTSQTSTSSATTQDGLGRLSERPLQM